MALVESTELSSPLLRVSERPTITQALEAIAIGFDLERLREIDRSLRQLPDSELTREDVAQMFDVTLAWGRGGKCREALPIATKALRRARALGDPALIRNALNSRAAVADGTLDIGTAIECLLEALRIAEALGDIPAQVKTFANLGACSGRISLNVVALRCSQKALALLRAQQASLDAGQFSYMECHVLCGLADCHLRLGSFGAALHAARLSQKAGKDSLASLPPLLREATRDFILNSQLFELSALVRLNMLSEADQLSEEIVKARAGGGVSIQIEWDTRWVLAELMAARGERGRAIAELKQVIAAPAAASCRREAMLSLIACYELSGLLADALSAMKLLQAEVDAGRREVALEELSRIDGIDAQHDDEFDQIARRQIANYRVELEGTGARMSSKLNYLDDLAVSAELREGSDKDSAEHIYRVGALSSLLAAAAGCNQELCWIAEVAGRLHDIGKSSIPDSVVLRARSLNSREWAIVRTHSDLGARLLADANEPRFMHAVAAVRHHHERYDGGGYPSNLRGDQIPLLARIVSIAESFDAMLQSRAYRPSRSVQEALLEIEHGAGIQFDPRLTGIFVHIVRGIQTEVDDLKAFLGEQGRSSSSVQAFKKLNALVGDHEVA